MENEEMKDKYPTVYYLCRVKPTDKYTLHKGSKKITPLFGPFADYQTEKAEQKRLNAQIKKDKMEKKKNPYVRHAYVKDQQGYRRYLITPGNLNDGDTFNYRLEQYRVIEMMTPIELDQDAWIETLSVVRKLDTTSSTKTMAAYLVFANASPNESYLDTWNLAYKAAKAEPYAEYEYEGS